MVIRKAGKEELDDVLSFYNSVIDGMQYAASKPGWKRGIYPDEQYLNEAIQRQELYVGVLKGAIAGAMVLNHESEKEYDRIKWKVNANSEEVTVIHTLGISTEHQRQGLAGEMVRFVFEQAAFRHQKAVRLDVLFDNISAQRFYLSLGFEYRGTVTLFYEDTGMAEFLLYEYVL